MDEIGREGHSGALRSGRWPNVPACYGWLSLDRRGAWRLKGEPIRHAGLIEFINRNYGPDGQGNWVFQNGPQAVFVDLDYTPLVLRLGTDESLSLHTGRPAGAPVAAYLDLEGNVLVEVDSGIGLLDDRDLASFVADCRGPNGSGAIEDLLATASCREAQLWWQGLELQAIRRDDVKGRFGFRPLPRPV